MPWVGFEPTILVFDWAKTFHDVDRAATVIGMGPSTSLETAETHDQIFFFPTELLR
jgi:hypothetical protein